MSIEKNQPFCMNHTFSDAILICCLKCIYYRVLFSWVLLVHFRKSSTSVAFCPNLWLSTQICFTSSKKVKLALHIQFSHLRKNPKSLSDLLLEICVKASNAISVVQNNDFDGQFDIHLILFFPAAFLGSTQLSC